MARHVRVDADELVDFTTGVFTSRGMPPPRAAKAAAALCYGDMAGISSHGLANLTQLYLPLFEEKRVEPDVELTVMADRGAALLVDAGRGLGLWVASEAMDLATARAAEHGIGLVSVRNATHFGCAGYHAARAVDHNMIGIVASNCGRQRIIRPPGGRLAMLGTNPFSIAAPAGDRHPYVLDMSTTVVPTGRVRAAARAGEPIPVGWLADNDGNPVTDPGAFDRGEAHLQWLGGRPETGAYKGYGLSLLVEVLAAVLPGAGLGPDPEALAGDGRASGRDDDIGFLVLALAPGTLRPIDGFLADAERMFGSLQACPPVRAQAPVSYPGWREAEHVAQSRTGGVALEASLHQELTTLAAKLGLQAPCARAGAR